MRKQPHLLFTILLSTALVACSTDGDRNTRDGQGNTMDRTSARDAGQDTRNNASPRTGTSRTAGGQQTLSISCLDNMDRSAWRQMGLNDDQISRVDQLQQRSRNNQGTGTDVQGGHAGGEGTPTTAFRDDNTGTRGTQGGQQGTTGGQQGTTGQHGTTGSQHGTTGSGQGGDLDQATQRGLRDILSNDQMASLGRRCQEGAGGRSNR